ncbi:GNAT family N-acetyltransferase [Cytobacillus kochii]
MNNILITGDVKLEFYLKKLTIDDNREIYEMLQDISQSDNGFHNEVNGLSYDEYTTWLEKNDQFSEGIGLEEWMVPQTTYWLFYNSIPVGYGRIRHYLNENLKSNSGHIGYAIAQSYRGKGYGHRLLKLLLQECTELGIKTVQVGVNKSNVASNKVVQNNGGVLVKNAKKKNIYHIVQN